MAVRNVWSRLIAMALGASMAVGGASLSAAPALAQTQAPALEAQARDYVEIDIRFDKNASDATGFMSVQTASLGYTYQEYYTGLILEFEEWLRINDPDLYTAYINGWYTMDTPAQLQEAYYEYDEYRYKIEHENDIVFDDGVWVTLNRNQFTRDGYRFVGWNTHPSGYGDYYADGESIFIDDGLTLYAQWTPSGYSPLIKRLSGYDRYGTMSAIVSEGFSNSTWAVVATGDAFPDALAAASLAGARGCPVILTGRTSLSLEASSQLSRLGVRNVYIVGGPGSVSTSVENDIRARGISVQRVAGDDRVGTSLNSMQTTKGVSARSHDVIIVNGWGYADALAIGPWAYATQTPIILANGDGTISEGAVAAINSYTDINRVILVGGTSVVSDYIQTQLGSRYSYLRLGGINRYDTCAKIVQFATANGLNYSNIAVATGRNFPDALAAGAFIGSKGGVLLLADSTGDASMSLVASNKSVVKALYLIGGTGVVSDSLANSIDSYLR